MRNVLKSQNLISKYLFILGVEREKKNPLNRNINVK